MAGRATAADPSARAEERHVLVFVAGDLGGELADRSAPEPDLAAAFHGPALPGAVGQVLGQPFAVHGIGVELCLEVFEVQREVEDRAVRNRVRVMPPPRAWAWPSI